MSKCMELLAIATTAIRDHYMGFPDDEIVAASGNGMKTLLRDLVSYLRENGVNDEGGWDCDVTEGIPIKVAPSFEPFRLVVEVYAGWERAAPMWASLQITPDFLHGIADKVSFCKEHDVYSVTAPMPLGVEWESGNDLRIQGEILVVHDAGFQIEAYPKHAGYPVYTREVTLTVLESLAKGAIPKAGFYGDARRLGDRVFGIASDRWILDDIVEDYLSFQEDQAVA